MSVELEANNNTMSSEANTVRKSGGWLSPPFQSSRLRGPMMGTFISITMAEMCVYLLLTDSIKQGQLPWFTTDAVIAGVSLCEVLLAPLVSWLGYRSRRTMIMCWIMVPLLMLLLVTSLSADKTQSGTEICTSSGEEGVFDYNAGWRLAVVALVGMACVLGKVGLWSHGVAYMDEHKTGDIGLHVGILAAARVLALLMMPKLFTGGLVLWGQVLLIALPTSIAVLLLFRIPLKAPPAEGYVAVPLNKRGFGVSLARVLSNKLAISQMVAMALLAAALWGFAWHETDIIKVKHLTVHSDHWMAMYADVLRYHVVVFAVIIFASKYATPAISPFDKATAAKTAMIASMMVFPLFIVMVSVFGCERGDVAGLATGNYSQPACSQSCGCSSTRIEFEPVCVLDQMTTYLSPCHAGCSVTDSFGGLEFASNCTCAPVGGLRRAAMGACSSSTCSFAYELHKIVYAISVIMIVLVFQALGVGVLRSVDERDRSVALGVATAFISLFTFVIGHAAFFCIRALMCIWWEGERCLLQNSTFPYAVGGLSSVLALLSALLSLVTFIKVKGQKSQRLEPSDDVNINDA